MTEEEQRQREEAERAAAKERADRGKVDEETQEKERKRQAEINKDRKMPVIEDFDEDCIHLDEDDWSQYPDLDKLHEELSGEQDAADDDSNDNTEDEEEER